jgi:hypothetical protein
LPRPCLASSFRPAACVSSTKSTLATSHRRTTPPARHAPNCRAEDTHTFEPAQYTQSDKMPDVSLPLAAPLATESNTNPPLRRSSDGSRSSPARRPCTSTPRAVARALQGARVIPRDDADTVKQIGPFAHGGLSHAIMEHRGVALGRPRQRVHAQCL